MNSMKHCEIIPYKVSMMEYEVLQLLVIFVRTMLSYLKNLEHLLQSVHIVSYMKNDKRITDYKHSLVSTALPSW